MGAGKVAAQSQAIGQTGEAAAKALAGITIDWAGPDADVLVLRLDHPPANALDAALRGALDSAIAQYAAQARALVLISAGRHFSAATGLDLLPAAAPGVVMRDPAQPSLADLALRVEALPIPVVAALDGLVLAGGAELALAAHARIAGPDMRFALPGVSLGLPPQAGASQRLPRIVGATEALAILLQARMVPAGEALAIGLVDDLSEGDLLEHAVAYALSMPGPRPSAARLDGVADMAAFAAAIAQARAMQQGRGPLPAPERIIDCVEAAIYLPFENGLALEEVAYDDLARSPQAVGLIAAARGERRLAQTPLRHTGPNGGQNTVPLSTIAVIGAEASQAALVFMALSRGLRVLWQDGDAAALSSGLAWVEARQAEEHRAGRLTASQKDADRARLHRVAELADLAGAAAVLVGTGTGPGADGAALAQLASSNPLMPQIFSGGAPGQIGLVVAPSIRICELGLPPDVDPDHAATAIQLMRRLGLPPVAIRGTAGVGHRVHAAGQMALRQLLAQGVPRRILISALDHYGQSLPDLADRAADSATAAAMRAMSEYEVQKRWLAAMANEGLRQIDASPGLRPSDIDQLLITGYGFPRWQGGAMHQAAMRGALVLRADLRRWQADGSVWKPHPLLDQLIADGRRLDELD